MVALLVGAAAATPMPPSAAPAGTGTGTSNSVTLITGDRVMVAGNGFRVVPGPGRQVDFTSQMRQGHLYVILSDARTLVAGGMLDRRLFDVTQLLAWRYDDARRSDIPLIAQSAQVPTAALQARRLAGAGMTTLRVPKESAGRTWKDLTSGARALSAGNTKLWLDGRRFFDLDQSVKQIGANTAWERGLTGEGVTVAVLDSGYDPDHPDLKERWPTNTTSAKTLTSATSSAMAPTSPRPSPEPGINTGAWRPTPSWPLARSAVTTASPTPPSWRAWNGPPSRSRPRSST
nr:hypothetical protein [Streptosporangium pseudovulgare]